MTKQTEELEIWVVEVTSIYENGRVVCIEIYPSGKEAHLRKTDVIFNSQREKGKPSLWASVWNMMEKEAK